MLSDISPKCFILPCFFLYKAAPMSLNLFEAALVHKTREKKKAKPHKAIHTTQDVCISNLPCVQ